MPYDDTTLKRDGSGITPVPQHFNPTINDYEPIYGRNNAGRVELYGPDGNPITTSSGKLAVRATDIETLLNDIKGKDFATQTTLAAILAKIIAAPATEAKQMALNALIGEVQASPTANTLLARLKSLEDKIDKITNGTSPASVQLSGSIPAGTNNIGEVDLASALPAGTALIGKVGIDQTTPGTTNAVFILRSKTDQITTAYTIRDTNELSLSIEHASIGVYEQSIIIENTLDVALTVNLYVRYTLPSVKKGPFLWGSSVDANLPANGRFVLAPVRGLYAVDTATSKLIEVADLAQPHYTFRLSATAESVPTTGVLNVTQVRRF